MALTRPTFNNIVTSVVSLSDPLTVLHGGATAANVDVGFLLNRANGLVSNVALYWNESGQSFVTAFTANSGVTDTNVAVTSYANISTGAHTITPSTTLNSVSTTTGALVVAGGVGANRQLRNQLSAAAQKMQATVHYPQAEWCTDNGAMIAMAAAMRMQKGLAKLDTSYAFDVLPRWPLTFV